MAETSGDVIKPADNGNDDDSLHDISLVEEEMKYLIPQGCTVAPGPPPQKEVYASAPPVYMYMDQPGVHPPAYESVVPDPSVMPLTYVDFLPRCLPGTVTFERFDMVLGQANIWLSQNPMYEARTCESIERIVKNEGILETESTFNHESSCGENKYVRGVRLWLVFRSDPSQPPQQIGYFTVIPDYTWKFVRSQNVLCMATQPAGFNRSHHASSMIKIPTFDSFSRTIDKLNKRLGENPLPGKIFTVETLQYKYCESWHDDVLDPDKTYWTENGNNAKIYVFMIRVFYIHGPSANELIGIRDFKPECISKTVNAVGKPRFENFTSCLYKGGNWLYSQKGIRVTNIQNVNIKLDHGMNYVNLDAHRTEFVELSFGPVGYVRIIRLCFAVPITPEPSPPIQLTSRLFIPAKLSSRHYEPMSQLIQRIIAWLRLTRAKVLTAQTMVINIHPEAKIIDAEKVTEYFNTSTGNYWLTCIRLYFDGVYPDPPAHMLPPVPVVNAESNKSNSCSLQ